MASEDIGPIGALPPKTRELTALGCAFALRREDRIESCVTDCLRAGATPEEIMEVLRLALLCQLRPLLRGGLPRPPRPSALTYSVVAWEGHHAGVRWSSVKLTK